MTRNVLITFLKRNVHIRNQRFSSSLGPDKIIPSDSYVAWDPEAAVKLRIKESGPESSPPVSVPTLFKTQVENLPNNLALRTRGPNGEHLDWTWSDYYEDVTAVSKGFISLGLEPFHSVAILGYNDPAWHMSNLGSIHAGGFSTGIYQTNNPTACQFICEDSRANIVVVGDKHQLGKILSIRDKLPHLRAIVQYGEDPVTEPGVISWDQLKQIGRDQTDSQLRKRLGNIAVNQCCNLAYTSGTTGNPKGTMLSHDTVTYTALRNTNVYDWLYGKETVMSYLPLSHTAGFMMDVYLIMSQGGTCNFADKNALKGTLVENFKYFKPSRMCGVTRVFEKMEEGIKKQGANNSVLKKMVGNWAKRQALNHHEKEMSGVMDNSIGYRLAKKLLLSKVHEALGFQNLIHCGIAVGGSAVPPETVRYFLSLDIKLLEVISCTESCGMIQIGNFSKPGMFSVGKVGLVHPDLMECKLKSPDQSETGKLPDQSEIGELLCRGRSNLMGYLNNKEKTMEAMDDQGWLHTGDLLKRDETGFYEVVGRIKEIIITAGGENIAPTNIEEEIKLHLSNIVSIVMVVGDAKKYLTCLLTLKVEVDPSTMLPTNKLDSQAVRWIKKVAGGCPDTVPELLASPYWIKVEAAIQAGIDKANDNAVSNVAKIKNWKVVPREFSVDSGELSPSLKLKRFYVAQLYSKEIDEMYRED